MRIAIALLATAMLGACASMEALPEVQHDPNHKQFLTGSRIAHKGRGGPDAVKSMSGETVKDAMRSRIEAEPQSK